MASKKRNRKSSKITLQPKKTIDPRISGIGMTTLKFSIASIILLFVFLSMYDMAGMLGGGVKWTLTAIFGGGAPWIPYIGIYIFVVLIMALYGHSYKLKITCSVTFIFFVSVWYHFITNTHIENLGLQYVSDWATNAQSYLNGGVAGIYIAELLRRLFGNITATAIAALGTLASAVVMFGNIIGIAVVRLSDLFKGMKKEKTSNIFRLPGVKTPKEVEEDKKLKPEKEKTKKPEKEIKIDIPFDVDTPVSKGDVIIEKFTPDEPKTEEKVKKEPSLTKKEINTAAQELEEAKNAEIQQYVYPSIDLLSKNSGKNKGLSREELNQNAVKLVSTLREFGVNAEVVSIQEGPAVTRYEIIPESGIKISKILGLSDDIALRMAAKGIRIAPIPGKNVIGVEIANKEVMPVCVRDVIDTPEFKNHKSKISFALGKDIAGTTIVGDIAKMPHCLIAGSTGSGKSVCINSLITSLIYKASPEEVKMIMVDPKVVELSVYNGIPHLLIPVVTDPRKAAGALNWAVTEMLNRYNLFAKENVRDLESYNEAMSERGEKKLPKIVIIIDELADLMIASPKEVEEYICRLAQLARAAGMHLIIATQRPSVDVITGLIKANVPSRIAFAVSSQIDSRTILDIAGAEKLLGKGDMLYAPVGMSKPIRVQGAFISDKEVERIVSFLKNNAAADYDDDVLAKIENASQKESVVDTKDSSDEADVMLPQCIEFVVDIGEASVSKLQRRFKLGYSRAARIVDQMEERGIVGPSEGSKPRQVLITKEQYQQMMMSNPEYQA